MISQNIPRHLTAAMPPTTWGYFVDRGGGNVVLVDHNGTQWPAGDGSMVRYAGGGTTNTLEGIHRAPRPWRFNPDGTPLVEGDFVTIEFLDGNPKRPLVRPGIRPLNPDEAAVHPVNPIGQDPNPIRARFAARDASSGAVTGTLQITTLDGGNGFELVVGGSKFGEGSRLTIDHDAGTIEVQAGSASGPRVILDAQAGTIKLGQGSETHQVGFGEAMVQALKTLAEAILAVDASQAAKLPSSAPVATATVTPVLADCVASLAAGPPYLSTIVRVE